MLNPFPGNTNCRKNGDSYHLFVFSIILLSYTCPEVIVIEMMIRTHWTWKSIFSQSPYVFVGVESNLGVVEKNHGAQHRWWPLVATIPSCANHSILPSSGVKGGQVLAGRKWELSIAVFEYWRIWRAISFVLGNQIYDSSAFCMMFSCLVVETHGCAKTVAWKPGFLREIGWFWGNKSHVSTKAKKKPQCSCKNSHYVLVVVHVGPSNKPRCSMYDMHAIFTYNIAQPEASRCGRGIKPRCREIGGC